MLRWNNLVRYLAHSNYLFALALIKYYSSALGLITYYLNAPALIK